jgi:hypothetical protein
MFELCNFAPIVLGFWNTLIRTKSVLYDLRIAVSEYLVVRFIGLTFFSSQLCVSLDALKIVPVTGPVIK